jgi:hypothetical protein
VAFRKVEGAAYLQHCPTCTDTSSLSLVNSLFLLPLGCRLSLLFFNSLLLILCRLLQPRLSLRLSSCVLGHCLHLTASAYFLRNIVPVYNCLRHQSLLFTMSTQHVFRPLDKDKHEIRLLHLHAILPPKEEGREKRVAAHFSYTSLSNDQHEKFMALSYVWGEANYLSSVVLGDGSHIPITKNLLVAIEHLFANAFVPVSWSYEQLS